VVVDPECDAIFPYHFPAIVDVRAVSGQTYSRRVLANRGTMERPLSEDELALKFETNVGDGAAALRALVEDLDGVRSVSDLLEAAARTGRRSGA
jgi:2-methylcitrate dehydratase PrpD